MRWIDEKDVLKIKDCINPQKYSDPSMDSYFKTIDNNDINLTEVNYNSFLKIEDEILKFNPNIDRKLLRNILIASVKARAKFERELDEGLYEYAEAHKDDIPAFIYVI